MIWAARSSRRYRGDVLDVCSIAALSVKSTVLASSRLSVISSGSGSQPVLTHGVVPRSSHMPAPAIATERRSRPPAENSSSVVVQSVPIQRRCETVAAGSDVREGSDLGGRLT